MILFKEAHDREKIRQIKEHPYYGEDIKRINEIYEQVKDEPIEVLTKSEYFIFNKTGDRLEFERKYFERRTRLDIYFAEYLLYERKEDLERLEDIIWAICGEFSWALPAHVGWENAEEDMACIDLFAAETGQALSEIMYILNDKLSDYIKTIMMYEIRRRIIDSFKKRTFHWETVTNNWAAVCAGSIGMTLIYASPQKYEYFEKRLMKSLENFLSGYGDDGICTEGLGYWNYGFGYYTFFAQLLFEFSDGKKNIMNGKKIREIVQFQQRMYLSGNTVISFADGGRNGYFEKGLTHRLKELFPDYVTVPDKSCESEDFCFDKEFYKGENRFPMCLRNLLWSKPEYARESILPRTENYYSASQWYTNVTEKLGFAAKSGNNGEPHNHNDIGGFIIAADNEQYIADIGAGEYTKDYFHEGRYDILCCSSKGHSVPVIDGHLQSAGKKYAGKVLKADGDEFITDIAGAYDIAGLNSVIRTFSVYENGVKLSDEFDFADGKTHNIQEYFISVIEPEKCDGYIRIGGIKVIGAEETKILHSTEKNHNGEPFSMWRTEYSVSDNKFSLTFELI